jgi:cyd operon protein YbgT
MWYFSWILGLGLACAFAILNAMWYEVHATDAANRERNDAELPDELS